MSPIAACDRPTLTMDQGFRRRRKGGFACANRRALLYGARYFMIAGCLFGDFFLNYQIP
jgi:hypothetical protein